eukprot:2249231-Lingulodinium_polyedra.AAC.1
MPLRATGRQLYATGRARELVASLATGRAKQERETTWCAPWGLSMMPTPSAANKDSPFAVHDKPR